MMTRSLVRGALLVLGFLIGAVFVGGLFSLAGFVNWGKMETRTLLIGAVFVVGLFSLGGFFCRMHDGFGPYNTSALVLLVVLTVSGLLLAADCLPVQVLGNIFFAVVGFAGGLFTREKVG
jgi:hypothetical protein